MMDWQEVCEHPALHDLPFKIELNEYGQLVMSPVKVNHSAYQGEIAFLLRQHLPHGRTLPECAIATPKGTKVADVAWVSPSRFDIIRDQVQCPVAPEICVEVTSASNTEAELQEKRGLYFQQGAQEVWVCREGELRFYDAQGERRQSELAPGFPARVVI